MTVNELVTAIVNNNPLVVKQRLHSRELVGNDFVLTPMSFMQTLQNLPNSIIATKEQAVELVTELLDIQIIPNGNSGSYLLSLQSQYQLPLQQIVRQVFQQQLPTPMGLSTTSCSCHQGEEQGFNTQQIIVLVLALIGALSVLIILARLIHLAFK